MKRVYVGLRFGGRQCFISAVDEKCKYIEGQSNPFAICVLFDGYSKDTVHFGKKGLTLSFTNISNCVYSFFELLGKRYIV